MREVRLTNLDKVLFPATGFTKADLVGYYARASSVLVPHLSGRPLTLGRFPDGVDGPGFAQTECRGRPDWMETRAVRLRDGTVRNHCLANDRESLLWIANQGTVELHPFLWREDPSEPTAVAFDLDPGPGAGLEDCCAVALRLRRALSDRGLSSVAKTSGSYGLHVYASVGPGHSFGQTKAFARSLGAELAAEAPDRVIDRSARSERAGKVFVDWAQNDPSRSTVAVYSLRAADRPAVSTPLTWRRSSTAAIFASRPTRCSGG